MSLRYSEGFNNSQDVSANKTLALTHQGYVQNVIADELTVTMPSVVVGSEFIIRIGGVPVTNGPVGSGSNGSVSLFTIAVAAGDLVAGLGSAGTDADGLKIEDANVGDYVRLLGSANGWQIAESKGAWVQNEV